ncbi:hypothetical protein Scep_025644 [Stephania cephalantha]|uniref:pyruvate kinase n=1 Tax=Stephania cephalantha TaxID=152367 RepID=A0AAP0EL50_9MAGN
MTLCLLPRHFTAHRCSLPNHDCQRADTPAFTIIKSSGASQYLTSGLFVRLPKYGNHLIQLEVRPKGNSNRRPVTYASRKRKGESARSSSNSETEDELLKSTLLNVSGNGDSARESSEPTTGEELIRSILLASGGNLTAKNSDVEVAASDVISEENLIQDVLESSVDEGALEKLKAVQLHILALEQWNASRLKLCHRDYLAGAANLVHYLALKCLDISEFKKELYSIGLNLETVNSHVLASITLGIHILEHLESKSQSGPQKGNLVGLNAASSSISSLGHLKQGNNHEPTIITMRNKIAFYHESLLGKLRDGRTTHIMVTVGKEIIENETLISDIIRAGATIVRINCAHGEPSVWSEIIRRVKRSSQMLERPCRILMDLAGPKLRTGFLGTGPSVMKISPKKDARGNVILPAEVWLSHKGSGPPPAHLSPNAVLSIDDYKVLKMVEVGNVLRFRDARGKLRTLKVAKKFPIFAGIGCVAECSRVAYMESGTVLYMKGNKGKLLVGRVVDIPGVEQFVRVRVGDSLIISRDPCVTPESLSKGSISDGPRITCSSSHLFDSVKPGEPIAFDDGKIWGVIQGTSNSEIVVSITHASPKGSKLGSEKSINIPKSDIRFEGLTSKDLKDLDFVASHADMVGISFVRDVCDVAVVKKELEKRKLHNLGIVLKIETQSGFENLPFLLLQAMQSPNPLGIMIARGDLAVECGWEALADIQEEIMSISGAAQIPVIWATQVLESLVKFGQPTRAEITDVACGKRASCIMLNKGKYIAEAVAALDSILDTNSSRIKTKLKPLVPSSNIYQ